MNNAAFSLIGYSLGARVASTRMIFKTTICTWMLCKISQYLLLCDGPPLRVGIPCSCQDRRIHPSSMHSLHSRIPLSKYFFDRPAPLHFECTEKNTYKREDLTFSRCQRTDALVFKLFHFLLKCLVLAFFNRYRTRSGGMKRRRENLITCMCLRVLEEGEIWPCKRERSGLARGRDLALHMPQAQLEPPKWKNARASNLQWRLTAPVRCKRGCTSNEQQLTYLRRLPSVDWEGGVDIWGTLSREEGRQEGRPSIPSLSHIRGCTGVSAAGDENASHFQMAPPDCPVEPSLLRAFGLAPFCRRHTTMS